MSISILNGTNDKPASSQALAEAMRQCTNLSGRLFIGYPIVRDSNGPRTIDALLVSPDKGIVIFDLIEGTDPGDYGQRQYDAANLLEARLKPHRGLMRRRDLRVPIRTLSFAAVARQIGPPDTAVDCPLITSAELTGTLDRYKWDDPDRNDLYRLGLSAIESISTIRTARKRRPSTTPKSRGAKLGNLEASISTMDHEQGRAVFETVEGVQRIRGLAGSGKTVVLALKAAYLHVQQPDWRIGVTFHTRSLKGYFRRLIGNFCVEQTGEDPDWSNMRVVSSWGSPTRSNDDGLYLEFCLSQGIEYLDFLTAKQQFIQGSKAFEGACRNAIDQFRKFGKPQPRYDAILVDEAQDLPDEFLQICYELLVNPNRLVYAYDELQNLTGTPVSTPESMFGTDADGQPRVHLDSDRSDIILQKCYRNSRPVLTTAHALGFGIYRQPALGEDTGLTQMFDNAPLWQEIGYDLQAGKLQEGCNVTLARTPETSPAFLENHSDIDDLIKFVCFNSKTEQANWVANEIRKNLEDDELRPDDIVVINLDPLTTRNEVGPIRARLLDFDIKSHIAGVDTSTDEFYRDDANSVTFTDEFYRDDANSVTFTGVYRAKGNEAGMVYVINAQDSLGSGHNLASIRNRLFVAITRSKAWVRVTGVGSRMRAIESEYESLRQEDYRLQFTYPTEEQREHLRLIHRDMTAYERNRVQKYSTNLENLIGDLQSGAIHKEDLNAEQLATLNSLLGS